MIFKTAAHIVGPLLGFTYYDDVRTASYQCCPHLLAAARAGGAPAEAVVAITQAEALAEALQALAAA